MTTFQSAHYFADNKVDLADFFVRRDVAIKAG